MKKYKRLAAAVFAGLMTFSLAACGTNNTGSSDAAPTDKGTTEVVANDAASNTEATELKMIFWDSNHEAGLVAMADAFMKQNSNITVTVETIPWDEYWTKLQAAATGGDMPDVVVMHPDEVENYARGGKLLDLTEHPE